MTDFPKPPDGNAFSDSDQQWFDRLSGKVAPVRDADAVREAEALALALRADQEALDADPALAAATTEAALQGQWEQLQFRLKREGLRQTPATESRQGWGQGWGRRWPAAVGLAAAVLFAAVLLPDWPGSVDTVYEAPPVMRGEPGRQTLRVSRPRPAAEAFAAMLRAAGLRPASSRPARPSSSTSISTLRSSRAQRRRSHRSAWSPSRA